MTISRYEARHIESAATDKSDDQWSAPEGAWTTGDLEHTLSGLEDGTQYDVQVRALSAAGTGLWSESVSAKTLASDDAALIGLRLPGVRLTPAFASGTTAYTATVGYTLDLVTIEATRSDDDATVEYLDVDGVALTDADVDTAPGFQADLAVVGENVIQVRVTADDGNTTQTYRVTVTRVEQDLSLTPTRTDESAPFLSTATYSVRFEGDWTTSVTPDGVPGGAHFSRLIGGVHNAGVRFLESTAAASPAVEAMAEDGDWMDLRDEIANAGPDAVGVLRGGTDFIRPEAQVTLTAEVPSSHPRVTLTSMIAPSHDWFVGVSGLPLLTTDGLWLRTHARNLYPWDAGTENGTDFALTPDEDTLPQGLIRSIRGTGQFTTEPIASLTFTLQSVATNRSLDENTTAVVALGPPIAPAASSGTVSYSLGGDAAASFDLDDSTGQLRTKADATFDYETIPGHTLTVTVTATDTDGSIVTTVRVNIGMRTKRPRSAGRRPWITWRTPPPRSPTTTPTTRRCSRSTGRWRETRRASSRSAIRVR